MEVTKFMSDHIDIINVYRSNKGIPNELLGKLLNILAYGRSTLIIGDQSPDQQRTERRRLPTTCERANPHYGWSH